tara:strand:- start:10971 stop:11177 length:207 start_codon:yes stop_codon:yes gene_type:complete
LIIGAQKRNTVVNPQYANKICITKYDGYDIKTAPPRDVKIKDEDSRFLGANLSAKIPPYMYDKNATTP